MKRMDINDVRARSRKKARRKAFFSDALWASLGAFAILIWLAWVIGIIVLVWVIIAKLI